MIVHHFSTAFYTGRTYFLFQEENSGVDTAKRKDDWCDILREMDELWFHLLRSSKYMLFRKVFITVKKS